MHNLMKKYLQILAIELDDLKEDIELVMDEYEEKSRQHTITQYVLLENLAVLRNEIFGVDKFQQLLAGVNPTDHTDLESFISEIEDRFRTCIQACGIAEAVYGMIERKLHKVLRYVTHE